MEQKHVSFAVAKAIKEAGYPQYGHCDEYYNQEGRLVDKFCNLNKLIFPAPTYLEVWLWLWREKKVRFEMKTSIYGDCQIFGNPESTKYSDPEEAISEEIEFLVNNDLIK